jgi:2-polyprenyl-6-methoxyphenol hydroxylase-like FAD-dependent oxidoreductase
VPIEWPTEAVWLTPRGWMRRFSPGLRFVSCSRDLLESTVRRRVAQRSNVRFLEGHDVTDLVATADQSAVAGVRIRARSSAEGAQEAGVLTAGLVIDASGRHSKTPAWLEALGYTRPREERVDAFLGYASRDYAIPNGFANDWKAIMLQAKPPQTARTGYLFQIAPDRWRLSLMGAGRDYPPTDEEGFLAFVRSLRSPILAEAIADAEPLTPIFGYQQTENQRRYYERLHRLPEHFLVTGDALFAFNPIYGQGMTAAAQAALVLDQLLRGRPNRDMTGIGRQFHRAVAKANAGAWMIATGEDLRYETTEGGVRNFQTRLTHRYLDRVMRAATVSRHAHFGFLDVIQLVDPPLGLFRPGVLLPALLRGGDPDRNVPPLVARVPAGSGVATPAPVA